MCNLPPLPGALKQHFEEIHTEDIPYKCEKCDRTLKNEYRKRWHGKTHTEVKSYQC